VIFSNDTNDNFVSVHLLVPGGEVRALGALFRSHDKGEPRGGNSEEQDIGESHSITDEPALGKSRLDVGESL